MALALCLLAVCQCMTSAPVSADTARTLLQSKPVRATARAAGNAAHAVVSDSAAILDRTRHPVLNAQGDTVRATRLDSLAQLVSGADTIAAGLGRLRIFNPDPMRAMWLSALCPGLGQIYNRRYWKLPIIVGAFVGLGYGTQWNNRMLSDYSRAYRDICDSDPTTRSYMDFFPKTVQESDLDASWLKQTLKSHKDYYRRYRDICIFCLVGVYIVNVIDAYVDASMSHFDVSPDLSLDVAPAVIGPDSRAAAPAGGNLPSLGMAVSLNF